MKKITIKQKNSEAIILIDNDNSELTSYTKEISKVMELSKICILETTSGNTILKPSEINSISVEEFEFDKKIDEKIDIKKPKIKNNETKPIVKIENSVSNESDIIKD